VNAKAPARVQRLLVSVVIASVSAVLHYFRAAEHGGRSDFAPLWQAARLALEGSNPYALIGHGNAVESAWPMFYPATAFVVSAPFTLIPSFHLASTTFVFVSALLLAWGATHDGWHRLPIFPSIAFLTSASLGQWSILMTAMVYLPWLGFLAAAKPQNAAPVVGSSPDGRVYRAAIIGGIAILALSFMMVPSWPRDWWSLLGKTDNFIAPVFRFGGPLILIVLFRWRRPEAWLVAIAACMPQTWPPYNGLILFTVARTYREFSLLSLVSSASWIVFAWFANGLSDAQERLWMSAILNLFGYMPAALMVLRRPNEGPAPLWLSWIFRKFSPRKT
jgi:hypothetical protein